MEYLTGYTQEKPIQLHDAKNSRALEYIYIQAKNFGLIITKCFLVNLVDG